jgi:hypothetical protein
MTSCSALSGRRWYGRDCPASKGLQGQLHLGNAPPARMGTHDSSLTLFVHTLCVTEGHQDVHWQGQGRPARRGAYSSSRCTTRGGHKHGTYCDLDACSRSFADRRCRSGRGMPRNRSLFSFRPSLFSHRSYSHFFLVAATDQERGCDCRSAQSAWSMGSASTATAGREASCGSFGQSRHQRVSHRAARGRCISRACHRHPPPGRPSCSWYRPFLFPHANVPQCTATDQRVCSCAQSSSERRRA